MDSQIVAEMGKGPFKGRGSIGDVVAELRRQVDQRHDFVADTRDLAVAVAEDGSPRLVPFKDSVRDFLPREGLPMLDQALVQVAGRAMPDGIPVAFFRRAWKHNPSRMSDYLTGLMHDGGDRRLVRCLDNRVRAYLGSTYRTIDNLDVAHQALVLAEKHDAHLIEASVTDSHLRIRMVSREIAETLQRVRDDKSRNWFAGGLGSELARVSATSWGELPGDTVHPALGFRNSETGHGGYDLDGGILLAVCFNLAWVRRMVHEIHIGGRLDVGLFTEQTIQKEAELVHAKMRDASNKYFSVECFRELVALVEDAQHKKIRAPKVAVDVAIKSGSALRDSELDALLARFCQEPGGLTTFNLGQAVARHAQDVDDLDRAEDAENLAGRICLGELDKDIERATKRYEAELAVV